MHHVDVLQGIKPVRLSHECFGNNEGINLISLCFTDVVLTHRRSLNGVDDADLVASGDEEFDQVVTIVCRRFKTNDEAAAFVWSECRKQLTEAIIVISELERLNEYLAI